MKFRELEVVRLVKDVLAARTTNLDRDPRRDLKAGETGTIVDVFATSREAYEVEFGVETNHSILVTVLPDEIETFAQEVASV